MMSVRTADLASVQAAVAVLEGNATLTPATRRAIAGTLTTMLAEQRRLEALLAVATPRSMQEATVDWTNDLIARLRALWADGHSTAEIGRRLGISKNAVVGKAHRLQLTARASPVKRRGQPPAPQRMAKGQPTVAPLAASHAGGASLAPAAAIATAPSLATTAMAAPLPCGGRGTPCCWPIGTPGRPDFRFCDQASLPGKPYCQAHAELAYVRVGDRRDAA